MVDDDVLDIAIDEDVVGRSQLVDLRIRSIAFLLDYSFLVAAIYYTYRLACITLIAAPSSRLVYLIICFYAVLFVFMERKYDGSIFKKLLKIKNVSMEDEKLGIHIFIFKLVLRPIAFIVALIYLKFCFAILLWIFGIYKPLFKFLQGEIFILWYDYTIKQMTVKL